MIRVIIKDKINILGFMASMKYLPVPFGYGAVKVEQVRSPSLADTSDTSRMKNIRPMGLDAMDANVIMATIKGKLSHRCRSLHPALSVSFFRITVGHNCVAEVHQTVQVMETGKPDGETVNNGRGYQLGYGD